MTTPQRPDQEIPDDPPRASDTPAAPDAPASDGPGANGQPAIAGKSVYPPEPAAGSAADLGLAPPPGRADPPTDPSGFAVRHADLGAYQPEPWPYPNGSVPPGQPPPGWVRTSPGQPIPSWSGTGWRPLLPAPHPVAPPHLVAPPPPPPPPPTHKWGFGAFLLAEAVFLVASGLIVAVSLLLAREWPNLMPMGAALVIGLAVPTVLAALVAIMVTRWRGNGPIVDLRLKLGWRDVGIGIACGFTGVLVTIPASMLWTIWVGKENAYSAVGKVFDGQRLSPWLAVLVFLIVWLLAPLCEEILYRGLLWGAMERRSWNRWVILVVATVVFAVAHGELWRTPLLLIIGLPMGVARMLSGRLPAAVIAHQINNFVPALGLMLLLLGVPLTHV